MTDAAAPRRDSSDDTRVWEGGCRCGAVRYRAVGRPRWIAHCHCADCRRQTSAPYATWIAFRADKVSFQGELSTYASSPEVARGFCPTCGSPLNYTSPTWAGENHILVCTLDDPNGAVPTVHAYYKEALRWVKPGDGLPRYATMERDGPPLE